jgi:cold shock CspA family protein
VPDRGGGELFFHIKSVSPPMPRDSVLEPDSPVEFEITTHQPSGRLQAKNVRLI